MEGNRQAAHTMGGSDTHDEPARSSYCPRCRLGKLSDDGICLLCGTTALAGRGARRLLARTALSLVSLLLEPPAAVTALATLAGLVLMATLTIVVLPRALADGRTGQLFNPFAGAAAVLAVPSRPSSPILDLLWFGIGQALIFGLVLLTLLLLHARKQRRRPPEAVQPDDAWEGHHGHDSAV